MTDLPPAVRNRESAILAAGEAADHAWRDAALDALRWCAANLEQLTADDIWHRLEQVAPDLDTHEPSAMGPVMRRGANLRLIRKLPGVMLPHSRYAQRHRELQVWQSLTYNPPAPSDTPTLF